MNVLLAFFPFLATAVAYTLLSISDTDRLGFAAIIINPIVTPLVIAIASCFFCLIISLFRYGDNTKRSLDWLDYTGYTYQIITVVAATIYLSMLFS